jgi:hypothetical protein
MSVREILTRGFKAIMSTGEEIKIDADEIEVAQRAVATGQFIRVRQGIINPSYLVSIVEDKHRRIEFLEDTKYEPHKREGGMKSLADIFSKHVPRLAAGPPGEEQGRALPTAETKNL